MITNIVEECFLDMYYESTTFIDIADVLNEIYKDIVFKATYYGEELLVKTQDDDEMYYVKVYHRDDIVREHMTYFIQDKKHDAAERLLGKEIKYDYEDDASLKHIIYQEAEDVCELLFEEFVKHFYCENIEHIVKDIIIS